MSNIQLAKSQVHLSDGDPAKIGINNIAKPHLGDVVRMEASGISVFGGSGIIHQPGRMLVKDFSNHADAGLNE